MGRLPPPPSGWEWNGSQSRQGAIELGFPGRALGQMQSEAARRAGEPRIASLRIVTDRWGCNHVDESVSRMAKQSITCGEFTSIFR